MTATTEEKTLSPKQLENIYQPLDKIRFELNEGTPRSGKTSSDTIKMSLFYLQTQDPSHLVLAYSQEQAYRMFFDDGEGFGLVHLLGPKICQMKHDDHGDHLQITQPDTGRKIKVYYKGGGKVNAVGAITGLTLGSVVFLEYNLLHKDVIAECFRRTSIAKNRYHLAEQNPPAPNHPNLKLFKQFEDNGSFLFRHWRPHDNPGFTQERLDELYNERKNVPYLLNRDWYGNRVLPEGVIYGQLDITGDNPAHRIDKIPATQKYVETIITADGGTSDATTASINQIWFEGGEFHYYRIANYYHSNADTGDSKAMSDYAKEIQQFIYDVATVDPRVLHYNHFYIDPACKALRLELEKIGTERISRADNNGKDKAKGSTGKNSKVKVGIEYGQVILANKRFALVDEVPDKLLKYGHGPFLQEAGLYVYNDKTGDPADKNNHAMDEFRYMNNYFYKQYLRLELGL